jgi:hypothetical protein
VNLQFRAAKLVPPNLRHQISERWVLIRSFETGPKSS